MILHHIHPTVVPEVRKLDERRNEESSGGAVIGRRARPGTWRFSRWSAHQDNRIPSVHTPKEYGLMVLALLVIALKVTNPEILPTALRPLIDGILLSWCLSGISCHQRWTLCYQEDICSTYSSRIQLVIGWTNILLVTQCTRNAREMSTPDCKYTE